MKRTTKEWFDSAESDLLLISKIHLNENLTHLSAFHAQQAVEKSFKAIIEEFDLGFIKTHSLETLYNIIKSKMQQVSQVFRGKSLTGFYLNSSNPSFFPFNYTVDLRSVTLSPVIN